MKNVILIFLLLISCVSVHAQESDSKPRNAFEVQGGLTLSSRYNSRNYPGFVEYGVGVGAYAGAGYEVRFTPKWSV